jgi:hypothetical protein
MCTRCFKSLKKRKEKKIESEVGVDINYKKNMNFATTMWKIV